VGKQSKPINKQCEHRCQCSREATAWDAVVEALNDARPGWHGLGDTGQQAAVAAIKELGGRPKQRRRQMKEKTCG
jgi:hypothetical protein